MRVVHARAEIALSCCDSQRARGRCSRSGRRRRRPPSAPPSTPTSPQLARCANGLERDFVLLCERHGLPLPEPNPRIGRYRPDMLWREARLIVELDGRDAHSTGGPARLRRRRQAELEGLGLHAWSASPGPRSSSSPTRVAASRRVAARRGRLTASRRTGRSIRHMRRAARQRRSRRAAA